MGNDKTVTKVGKDTYKTGEQAEADIKRLCKGPRPKISLRATQEAPSEIVCAMIETKSDRRLVWVISGRNDVKSQCPLSAMSGHKILRLMQPRS